MSKGLLPEWESPADNMKTLILELEEACRRVVEDDEGYAEQRTARLAIEILFASRVAAYNRLFVEWEAAHDWQRERAQLEAEVERLQRLESYVCGVIAMGTQADLRVENLPMGSLPKFSPSEDKQTRIYDGGDFKDFNAIEPPRFFEDEGDPPIESEGRVE
jgi:hypothetical protein